MWEVICQAVGLPGVSPHRGLEVAVAGQHGGNPSASYVWRLEL